MQAVIAGYYGQGNGGDEALLVTLLQLLPPQVTAVVLSAQPEETTARYGVASCPHRDLARIFSLLYQSQLFIWGGGSLMQDVTSWASPFYYGGLMAIAEILGLKTLAWAQGIGPLYNPPSRWLTRQVLSRCGGVSVRDQASARLLSQWRIPHALGPDPVWLLEPTPLPPHSLPPPVVAVNLRPHPLLTPARLEFISQALRHFQHHSQAHIRLIPFQRSQDLALAQTLALALVGPYEILSREDPRQLLALFAGVDLTIGMRLHSLIMAASAGNRCFALSYDPKVTSLMTEIGIPGWELEALPTSFEEMSRIWQDHLRQGMPLSADQRLRLRQQTQVHQQLLASICQ